MFQDLAETLLAAGIDICDVDLALEGEWQRVSTRDKPRRWNGAVFVFSSRPLNLFCRNFATGVEARYREDSRRQTAKGDRDSYDRIQQIGQRKRKVVAAAARAERAWERALPAVNHRIIPTLSRKESSPMAVGALGTN